MFKIKNAKQRHLSAILKQVGTLRTNILTFNFDNTFSVFGNGSLLMNYRINLPQLRAFDIQSLDNVDGERIFSNILIEFSSDLRAKVTLTTGEAFDAEVFPAIRNKNVALLFETLSHFICPKLYEKLFADVLYNCLVIAQLEFLLLFSIDL